MNKILFFLLLSTSAFAQVEGQSFCEGLNAGTYFPLTVKKKTIVWYETNYSETATIKETVNGKTYLVFEQVWENGDTDKLYMREENGSVYEYEINDHAETLRYSADKMVGESWKNKRKSQPCTYRILSFDEKLTTPVCQYKNLLAMEADFGKATYVFYYLRGFGYIGATKNGKLVSYAIPKM